MNEGPIQDCLNLLDMSVGMCQEDMLNVQEDIANIERQINKLRGLLMQQKTGILD